jgi:hypothetical protein
MMTAAMQNVTNEKAPTMKCMQLFLTKFGERKKRQKKKSQNAGQLGRKRSRQITIGHKMSRARMRTFCVTIGHTDSVLVPAKQTKQQQAQAAETNLTRM